MPIEMPRGLPFSVDTWTPTSKKKRHHFLTHAHRDHSQGITTHYSYPIYATHITKSLVLQHFPQLDESLFVGIEVGQSIIIDDPDGNFTVTALDANHCPGAVMFLLEGNFGNILHTGDCRLTSECLQNFPQKYIRRKGKEPRCRLDCIFLDCTFGKFSRTMPSKHFAIRQVINCIWEHPDTPVVYLACDLLGQEEILVNVSQTFGSKIFVDKQKFPQFIQALTLTVPDILSHDPSSHFRLLDAFPKLQERADAMLTEARTNFRPEPLIIRPSAQWYAHEEGTEAEKRLKARRNEAIRDQIGVWHVCYSMHSCKEELEWALQFLSPRWVVSTTPGCWAMDLDYVKKHCFNTATALNDSLWKLLGFSMEAPATSEISMRGSNSLPLVEEMLQTCAESSESGSIYSLSHAPSEFLACAKPQSLENRICTSQRVPLDLSPPNRKPRVTLFGRARLGFQDFTSLHECSKLELIDDSLQKTASDRIKQDISFHKEDAGEVEYDQSLNSEKVEDVSKAQHNESEEVKTDDIIETNHSTSELQTQAREHASYSTVGSSRKFNETFRQLYRSMNVPVPQPLPSLVELLKANKRHKMRL